MFSTRLAVVFAILAAVAALPTDNPVPRPITTITDEDFDKGDSGWFSFPLFGNLFAPLWRLFPSFADFGPKITTDDNNFQVVVNVKDYKKDDLKVKVKGDFIFVQGSHEAKQDDHDVFASQFFHTYTLPANSSGSVKAELSSDGYLIVTAPINGEKSDKPKESDREVPIVETGVPYQKEEKSEVTTFRSVDEDKKEPTTPSQREEVTEKDNVIPHGNEIPL